MSTPQLSIPKLAVKAAVRICISFIVYFMMMKYLNLIHITSLRFLNIFILIGGLFATYRYYRAQTKILNIEYFDGILLGILTSIASFIFFAIFIYISFRAEPALLQVLKGNTIMMGFGSLTPAYAAATVIIEGTFSGLIISFAIMQYYKSGFYRTIQEKRHAGVIV